MKEETILNRRVQTVHLPPSNAPCPSGGNLIVAGWGLKKLLACNEFPMDCDFVETTNYDLHLRSVKMQCLPSDMCQALETYIKGDINQLLCVGDLNAEFGRPLFGDLENTVEAGDSGSIHELSFICNAYFHINIQFCNNFL